MIISDIVKKIKKSKSTGIITHINPDGDAIGSTLALGLALKKLGLDVGIIKNDDFPSKYEFLPGRELMVECEAVSHFPATLVALDCGDADRLGKGRVFLEKAETVINIDHHVSNTMFGNMNFVDANAAATAEIVYQVIKLLGSKIDVKIATCLFTAIVADTGCFRYDNTTQVTHTICGELISLGVKSNYVCTRVFHERTLSQTRVLGKAIETIKMYHGGRTAVMTVTKKMMEETGTTQGDLENVIDFARDIAGVKVAVLLKEIDENTIRIGFRSKEEADVSAIARKFGGGGHKRASGCTVEMPLAEALEHVLEEISEVCGG
jgi:phosphoesterase RecJ-like protein